MILYFPQDTPVERGPTRVIPGTHLQPFVQQSDHPFALVHDHIKAGTCFLIHFDIAHAALSNLTDSTRYMLKFIYLRRRNPVAPSWGRRRGRVGNAEDAPLQARSQAGLVLHLGLDARRSAVERRGGVERDPTTDRFVNSADQPARLEAIYALAAIGAEAIGPLRESLLQ